MVSSQEQPSRTCVACGRQIDWNVNVCPYCGKDYRIQAVGAPPGAHRRASSTSLALIIVIVVVVVAVIIGVILLAYLASSSEATITINVYSTHPLYTIECTIYVDGEEVGSDTIEPGYYIYTTITHRWTSDGDDTVRVSATSTGGGFGTQTDTEYLTVSDGESYTVDLYV